MTPDDSGPAEMRCRKCGYDLRGQDVCRCPECETRFHPGMPETYLSRPASGLQPFLWSIIAAIWFAMPWVFIAWGWEWTHEAVPTSLQILAVIGMLGVLGGSCIAAFVLEGSWKALNGKVPWIVHRGAFVAAAVISAGVMATFLFLMSRSLFRHASDWFAS